MLPRLWNKVHILTSECENQHCRCLDEETFSETEVVLSCLTRYLFSCRVRLCRLPSYELTYRSGFFYSRSIAISEAGTISNGPSRPTKQPTACGAGRPAEGTRSSALPRRTQSAVNHLNISLCHCRRMGLLHCDRPTGAY